MDMSSTIECLTNIVTYITPFAFLWAIVHRIYMFIMSAVTGGHRFM